MRSSNFILLAISTLALVGGAACAGSRPAAKEPSTSVAESTPVSAPRPESPATRAPRAASSSDDGAVLVVAKSVVTACEHLREVAEGTRELEPENVWVVILEGLSDCLSTGGLKAQRLLVTGDAEHRDIVRLVMAAKGAPMDRVIVRAPPNKSCGRKACPSDPRVDITLLP